MPVHCGKVERCHSTFVFFVDDIRTLKQSCCCYFKQARSGKLFELAQLHNAGFHWRGQGGGGRALAIEMSPMILPTTVIDNNIEQPGPWLPSI